VISLAVGRFERGWSEYVWRLVVSRKKRPLGSLPERFEHPVYLRCEQGLGDVVYFFRWLPYLKARGVTEVYTRYPNKIASVMRGAFPDVIEGFGPPEAVDMFIGDLPMLTGEFGVVPSINMHPTVELPKQKNLIGLTWRAGTKTELGQWKETSPRQLADLVREIGGIPVLLQRGASAEEKALFGPDAVDYCAECESTAFVLDLLPMLGAYVTVSNTNVHLAAGLPEAQRPDMHVLVTYPPDPRWMVRGDSSPWYPGMVAYRQNYRGEWEDPDMFAKIKGALSHVD
jgi:hypothetical protein